MLKCYRTRKTIWGKEWTVVIYLSDKLREGQKNWLNQVIAKRLEVLEELAKSLKSPRCKLRDNHRSKR